MMLDMDDSAQPLLPADVAGLAVISVEQAGRLLGIGRSAAYEAVRRDEIPAIRVGRRVLVPVSVLFHRLGITDVGPGLPLTH